MTSTSTAVTTPTSDINNIPLSDQRPEIIQPSSSFQCPLAEVSHIQDLSPPLLHIPKSLKHHGFKIITWNAQRTFTAKLSTLANLIASIQQSAHTKIVVAIQETGTSARSLQLTIRSLGLDWQVLAVSCNPITKHGGVCWLLPPYLSESVLEVQRYNARGISLLIGNTKGTVRLTNVYYPANRNEPTDDIDKWIRNILQTDAKDNRPCIVAGDLNSTWCPLDIVANPTQQTNSQPDPEPRILKGLFQQGLSDPGRALNPDTPLYTRRDPHKSWKRLDYILTSDHFRLIVTNLEILTEVTESDHHPVVLSLLHLPGWEDPWIKFAYPKRTQICVNKATEEQLVKFQNELRPLLTSLTTQVQMADVTCSTIDNVGMEMLHQLQAVGYKCLPVKISTTPTALEERRDFCVLRRARHQVTSQLKHRREETIPKLLLTLNSVVTQNLLDATMIPTSLSSCDVQQFRISLKRLQRKLVSATKSLQNRITEEEVEFWVKSRHELFRDGHIKKVLDRILHRRTQTRVNYIKRETDGRTEIIMDPEKVGQAVADAFSYQFRERTLDPQQLHQCPELAEILAPKAEIHDNVFEGLCIPPDQSEITEQLISMGNNKAAGPSGITKELLLAAGEQLITLLQALFTSCLKLTHTPTIFNQSYIMPIPKNAAWGGDVTKLRPIALCEVVDKLFWKILDKRMQAIIHYHPPILTGRNFSVLPGTSTTDSLIITRAAIDLTHDDKLPLYFLSNDIAKCFDSVSLPSLVLALRRIKIPEQYIKLLSAAQQHKQARVLTAYGPSPSFIIGSAVQQGSSQAPLHWRIVWDIVLTLVDRYTEGVKFSITYPSTIPTALQVPIHPVKISNYAYVDDTNAISRSATDMQRIMTLTYRSQTYLGIQSNMGKVELHGIHLDPTAPKIFQFGPHQVRLQASKVAFKTLGNYMRLDGSHKPAVQKLKERIQDMVDALRGKRLSHKLAAYILRSVLTAQLDYLWKTTVIPPSTLLQLDSQVRGIFKSICRLKRSTPNPILYHSELYNIPDLRRQHYISHCTQLINLLQGNDITSQITHIMIKRLMIRNGLARPSFLTTPALHTPHHSFFAQVCALLGSNFTEIRFTPTYLFNTHGTAIPKGIPLTIWKTTQKSLVGCGIFFWEQVHTVDGRRLTQNELKKKFFISTNRAQAIVALFQYAPSACYMPNPFFSQVPLQLTTINAGRGHFVSWHGTHGELRGKIISNHSEDGGFLIRHLRPVEQQDLTDLHHYGEEGRECQKDWQVGHWVECHDDKCDTSVNEGNENHVGCVTKQHWLDLHHDALQQVGSISIDRMVALPNQAPRLTTVTSKVYRQKSNKENKLPLAASKPVTRYHPPPLRTPATLTKRDVISSCQLNYHELLGQWKSLGKPTVDDPLPDTTIYTDGSRSDQGRMQVGIFKRATLDAYGFQVPSDFPSHSTTPETFGYLGALLLKSNQSTHIALDNSGVVSTAYQIFTIQSQSQQYLHSVFPGRTPQFSNSINKWYVLTPAISSRTLQQSSNIQLWTSIAHIYQQNPMTFILPTWVKGHSGIVGNEIADLAAESNRVILPPINSLANNVPMLALVNRNWIIHDSPRCALTRITRLFWDCQWTELACFSGIDEFQRDVNTEITILILNQGNKTSSRDATMMASSLFRYRIQLMHRQLPIQTEMRRRQPQLYANDFCRRCNTDTPETFQHLWTCEHAQTPVLTALSVFKNAVFHFVEQERKELLHDDHKSIWEQKSYWNFQQLSTSGFSAIHLLQGLVPTQLVTDLQTHALHSNSIRAFIFKQMSLLLSTLQESIWKMRCTDTIKWEKLHHITQRKKQSPRPRPHPAQTAPHSSSNTTEPSSKTICGRCLCTHSGPCSQYHRTLMKATFQWNQIYTGRILPTTAYLRQRNKVATSQKDQSDLKQNGNIRPI